jgi:single-stranded-DNA-specific exonuclease
MSRFRRKWWTLPPKPDAEAVAALEQQMDRPMAELLALRGFRSLDAVRDWIQGTDPDEVNPMDMAGMPAASERLAMARAQGELVFLFGDYDVDGTTAVSVGTLALRAGGWRSEAYIPDRYREGYGLSKAGIDRAVELGAKVLVALDCGVKAFDEIDYAVACGLDVIVADHHQPEDRLPNALAVLDPLRSDCQFGHTYLSGCGVGFLLWRSAYEAAGLDSAPLDAHLDLLALSIAADMVPMVGLNRRWLMQGMDLINTNPRPALKALIGERRGPVSARDLSFSVAPKINAAGRMDHGLRAVQLLTADELGPIDRFSQDLHDLNTTRRSTERRMVDEALEMAEGLADDLALVLYHPDWHKGIVGLIAQRVAERFYRPVVAFTEHEGVLSGSARSAPGLDLYAALDDASAHLIQFGGHKAAAGMTCKPENLDDFRIALNAAVDRRWPESMRQPQIEVDVVLRIDEVTPRLLQLQDRLEPFGVGNPAPVWGVRGVELAYTKNVGAEGEHLQVELFDPFRQRSLRGIHFQWGDDPIPEGLVDAAFQLSWNEYRGERTVQARLLDLQPTSGQAYL